MITSRTQNGKTDQYTYDELSRIQTETGTQKETYTYDQNGNRYSREAERPVSSERIRMRSN
ncbi:hypothetical protein [Paenibacillus sp.]|uniref:hypothetical protein n=1 Tax=Paenibacillus sp. TaxID=58172 RepID=UPI0034502229